MDKGIYFVTRLKSNAVYDEIRRRAGRRSKNIVDDEIIKLKGIQTPFRLIHYISPEDQHEYHFITNAMHLPAQTIVDIYKERWQIELFFLSGLSRIKKSRHSLVHLQMRL